MDKIDLILWVVSAGFAVNFGIMIVMWNSLNKRIDDLYYRMDNVEKNLTSRIDKIDEKLTDVDRRLCRLEGAFSAKECCVIKESPNRKIAE